MGYCYDVALTLDQAANKKLLDKLKTASDDLNEMFGEACDHRGVDPKSKVVLYHWSYSKWDDTETEFIDSFIDTIKENQYRYIRLGETSGDLEITGDLEDDPFDARIDCKIIYNKVKE